MSQTSQQKRAPSAGEAAMQRPPSNGPSPGQIQMKQQLVGKGFEAQAAVLSPEAPVQRQEAPQRPPASPAESPEMASDQGAEVAAEAENAQSPGKAASARDAQALAEGAPGATAEGPMTDPNDPRMSEDRKKMIHEGERRMGSRPGRIEAKNGVSYYRGGAPENGMADATNLFDGTQVQTSGTSCGLLPGVLLQRLGVGKNPKTKKIASYVTSSKTDGMEGFGTEFGCWVPQSGSNRPQPGDICVTNKLNGEFAHVCVVHSVGETTWTTMDSGQGRGLMDSAQKVTKQVMSPEEMLTAKLPEGLYFKGSGGDVEAGDMRKVHGWVDLDKLMACVRAAS